MLFIKYVLPFFFRTTIARTGIKKRCFQTITMEVDVVRPNKQIRNKKRMETSLNPQGYTENDPNQQPKTQLEQRTKMKNTKV